MTTPTALSREQVDNLIKHLDYASEIDELPAKASLLALFEENQLQRATLASLHQRVGEMEKENKQLYQSLAFMTLDRDKCDNQRNDNLVECKRLDSIIADLQQQLAEVMKERDSAKQFSKVYFDACAVILEPLWNAGHDRVDIAEPEHYANLIGQLITQLTQSQAAQGRLLDALRELEQAANSLVCTSSYHFEGNDVTLAEAIEKAQAAMEKEGKHE